MTEIELTNVLSCFLDKIIRHRACTLKDTAHAIIAAELDPEFNKMCEEIKEARRKRGMFNFIYLKKNKLKMECVPDSGSAC